MFNCDECGGPLERFEGECYCPDCAYYDLADLEAEAGDEARALAALKARLLAEQPPAFGPDEYPF